LQGIEGNGAEAVTAPAGSNNVAGHNPQPPTAPAPPATPKKYCASIFPTVKPELDRGFAAAIGQLESALGYPVWLILESDSGPFSSIDDDLYEAFYASRSEIERSHLGLMIHSSGGDATAAFKIARLFQRRARPLTTIIPKYAKSAATLMALAGSTIIKAEDAEFGPLDVQVMDLEREEYGSALNAVQSLERINAFSLTVIDQLTPLLMSRSGRRLDVVLPMVMDYTVKLVRPLLEKIDTVDFTRRSRELKVAEEYALRLMKSSYSFEEAKRIAQHLVDQYPTHEFVIDREECKMRLRSGTGTTYGIGLKLEDTSPEVNAALDLIIPFLGNLNVIGRVKEVAA